MHVMFKQIKTFFSVLKRQFFRERLLYSASALTFTSLLALVPLLSLFLSIFSAFPFFKTLEAAFQNFILETVVPLSNVNVHEYLQSFVMQARQLSLIGTVLLIATAILMLFTIEEAFNHIWKVRPRQGMSSWLRYWTVLTLAPLFLGIGVTITLRFFALPLIVKATTVLGIQAILLRSLSYMLLVAVLTLLYIIIPNCHVRIRYSLISAFVVSILFILLKHGFVLYIAYLTDYKIVYGTMAAIPIFFIWIYLIWVLVLFGALLSYLLTVYNFSAEWRPVDGFTQAFMWLGYLWQAQQQGRGLSLMRLSRLLPGEYEVSVGRQLALLQRAGLIHVTKKNEYMLARDLSDITLADLYQLLPWKLPRDLEKIHDKKTSAILKDAQKALQKKMNVSLKELYQGIFS